MSAHTRRPSAGGSDYGSFLEPQGWNWQGRRPRAAGVTAAPDLFWAGSRNWTGVSPRCPGGFMRARAALQYLPGHHGKPDAASPAGSTHRRSTHCRDQFPTPVSVRLPHEGSISWQVLPPSQRRPPPCRKTVTGICSKGRRPGSIGLLGGSVIGSSCIATPHTLTACLGPTASSAGTLMPAIVLTGFVPRCSWHSATAHCATRCPTVERR